VKGKWPVSSNFLVTMCCFLHFCKRVTHGCSLLSCMCFLSVFHKEKVHLTGRIALSFLVGGDPFRFGSHHMVLQYHEAHLCSLRGCFTMSCAFCLGIYETTRRMNRS